MSLCSGFSLCRTYLIQSMWAELNGKNFSSLLTWVFAAFAPSLKVIPDSSAQRPLSSHLKFHSALRSLKFKRGSNSWCFPPNYTARCGLNWWAVALLLERACRLKPFQFVKNSRLFWAVTSSSFCVLSVWASGWPCTASGIGTELERNGTIALAFGLKPAMRSDHILHTLLTCPDLIRVWAPVWVKVSDPE